MLGLRALANVDFGGLGKTPKVQAPRIDIEGQPAHSYNSAQ
jgi:hypothetical protein